MEIVSNMRSSNVNSNAEILKAQAMSKKRKEMIERVVKYCVFGVLLVILLFPFLFMILKSLMSSTDVNAIPVRLFPTEIHFENYAVFLDYAGYFFNSFIVIIINFVFVPITSCMVAYPLARYKFHGDNFMFTLILATSMVPSAVLLPPQYRLYQALGLDNNLASQYIGAFFGGSGMQIFLIIQFMRAIPKELDEAATIDGANKFRVFTTIMFPLCFNVCIYLGITVAMGRWTDFQGPLIYLKKDEVQTMAVAFVTQFKSSGILAHKTNLKAAMAVCMTIVPALLFFFFQKQMIGGVKLGAVKG